MSGPAPLQLGHQVGSLGACVDTADAALLAQGEELLSVELSSGSLAAANR